MLFTNHSDVFRKSFRCNDLSFDTEYWDSIHEYATQHHILQEKPVYYGICFDESNIRKPDRCRFYACMSGQAYPTKEKELITVGTKLQKAKQDYEPYKAQEDLNLIHELFPMMKEQLRIANLCLKIGLAVESIKALFAGKTLTAKSFSFFSPEHNQKFMAENINLKIEKEQDNPNKLRLNLNGIDILDWFRAEISGSSEKSYNFAEESQDIQIISYDIE